MARQLGNHDAAWWLMVAKQAKFRLRNVSEILGRTPRTVQRHVRPLFGRSAQEWLNERRLDALPETLNRLGSAKLADDELGFSDPAHLSRACKERYGNPPMRFLKRISAE